MQRSETERQANERMLGYGDGTRRRPEPKKWGFRTNSSIMAAANGQDIRIEETCESVAR